jgi:hypothetical protein
MPFVPTTVSMMTAPTVAGPSTMIVSDRWASARSHSSASVVAENGERYRYGPQKWTTPGMPGSLAQRRGSPVMVIEPDVAPW